MPDEKKKASQTGNGKAGTKTISRRDFAIGSVALIGTYSSTAMSAGAAAGTIKLEISDAVRRLLDQRHILDEDLTEVIQYAEKTGNKLYQTDTDRFLAKLYVENVYFYVEYSIVEGGYRIHTAYSHRFLL